MIISSKDASDRLNSPNNLINKLRHRASRSDGAMKIFTGSNGSSNSPSISQSTPQTIPEVKSLFNPFEKKEVSPLADQSIAIPPAKPQADQEEVNLDNLLEDNKTNIKLALAHNNAVNLLSNSIDLLNIKLDNVKADKLPSVIAAASKTIESIRKERNEANKNSKGHDVHYHFYTPTQKKISDYEIIEVEGTVEHGISANG